MKIFYCYRKECDNRGNMYTPAYRLAGAYPEWTETGLATFNDERIQTNTVYGRKIGWIDVDASVHDAVLAEIQTMGATAWLGHITEPEVITYLNAYTDYVAVPTDTGFSYIINEADIELGTPELKLSLSST